MIDKSLAASLGLMATVFYTALLIVIAMILICIGCVTIGKNFLRKVAELWKRKETN